MATKNELLLYSKINWLGNRVWGTLNDIAPMYAATILVPPFFLLPMLVLNAYFEPGVQSLLYTSMNVTSSVFYFTMMPAIMAYLSIVAFVGIEKILMMFKPFKTKLNDLEASLSPEYKKTYKFIASDDLIGLLKEKSYNLSPLSKVSLLTKDDPRNTELEIKQLAAEAGAITIFSFLQAIEDDRLNVIKILQENYISNSLQSLSHISQQKVDGYLKTQSHMDSFLNKLQTSKGYMGYIGKIFLNKVRSLEGFTFDRYSASDYDDIRRAIYLNKNQLERATEKILMALAQNEQCFVPNEGTAPEPTVINYTPEYSYRLNATKDTSTLFDEDQEAGFNDEDLMKITSNTKLKRN